MRGFSLKLTTILGILGLCLVLTGPIKAQTVAVMLGDSLTFGGKWSDGPSGVTIINQGVSGIGVAYITANLEKALVVQPDLIILQVGINDLARGMTVGQLVSGHQELWRRISGSALAPRLLICSLLTVNPDKFGSTGAQNLNARVFEANLELSRAAFRQGHDFLDLNMVLSRGQGLLGPEMTTYDGLHLTPEAYGAWEEAIRPYLASIGK
jgi:lysophospholipase L1-like esterase